MDLTALVVPVVAAILTVGAGLLVARRFNKLGGGEAQEKLNSTYKELNNAFEEKIALLQSKTDGLLVSLEEGRRAFNQCKEELQELAKASRRERLAFQLDADELRTELRGLRKRVTANSRRLDAGDVRQDKAAIRQTEAEEASAEHEASPPLTADVHPEP